MLGSGWGTENLMLLRCFVMKHTASLVGSPSVLSVQVLLGRIVLEGVINMGLVLPGVQLAGCRSLAIVFFYRQPTYVCEGTITSRPERQIWTAGWFPMTMGVKTRCFFISLLCRATAYYSSECLLY